MLSSRAPRACNAPRARATSAAGSALVAALSARRRGGGGGAVAAAQQLPHEQYRLSRLGGVGVGGDTAARRAFVERPRPAAATEKPGCVTGSGAVASARIGAARIAA